MTSTLIVSTYNRPDALRLTLMSILRQRVMPDEVVIGDDGSREETTRVVEEFRAKFPVPLLHVWQPDDGFRLARSRNQCVAIASGDYIIEIDGDLILHPDFVADHLSMAREGCYCKGGRLNIGRKYTARLCSSGSIAGVGLFMRGVEAKRENALHFPALARWLAPRYRRHREPALGCNMSFFRNDFMLVNGFDEFFEGWGGEDFDFGRRLQLAGRTRLHLKFSGVCYHLWHNDKFMHNKERNFEYRERENCPVACEVGVSQYDPARFLPDPEFPSRLIYTPEK